MIVKKDYLRCFLCLNANNNSRNYGKKQKTMRFIHKKILECVLEKGGVEHYIGRCPLSVCRRAYS